MPEYLEFRCCMCSNINTSKTICPPAPYFNIGPTPCRFVKSYIDKRDWKYKVMAGLGDNNFKARYQNDKHVGFVGWKCMRSLPWRTTFDVAQVDLNAHAKLLGWEEL